MIFAANSATKEKQQREAYEDSQKISRNTYQLRQRLMELKREYAGSIGLYITERSDRFLGHFDIVLSTVSPFLRKPLASLSIYVRPDSYHMGTSVFPSEEAVVVAIRQMAADLVVKRASFKYELPEWYTVLITAVAGLAGAATWIVVGLLFGLWGVLLGWLPMLVVFYSLRAMGPVALPVGAIFLVLWALGRLAER
jgi:hypothetical protein